MWNELGKFIVDLFLYYGITYSGYMYWNEKEHPTMKSFGWCLLVWIGLALFIKL